MTPFRELVGNVCAHTHTHTWKCWQEALNLKDWLCTVTCWGGEKSSLELGEKEQIEGEKEIEWNKTQQIGSFYLNTPSVVNWGNSSRMFACVLKMKRQTVLGQEDLVEKKADYLIFQGGMWIQKTTHKKTAVLLWKKMQSQEERLYWEHYATVLQAPDK